MPQRLIVNLTLTLIGTIMAMHLTATISLQQVLKGIDVHLMDANHAGELGVAPCQVIYGSVYGSVYGPVSELDVAPCQLVCSGIVGAIMLLIMQQRALEEMSWTAIVGPNPNPNPNPNSNINPTRR